jgi:fatty-acyl-CoA synthase
MSSLLHHLDRHAAAHPDRVFVEGADGVTTWGELAASTARLAAWLRGQGLGPGDRFAVLAKNRAEVVAAWLAACSTGAVVVPLNHRLQPPELAWILADAGVVVTLVADGLTLEGATASLTDVAHAGPAPARHDVPGGGPLIQMYTSGTTGRPKGALLGEAQLLALVYAWLEEMPLLPADRTLQVTPLFHVGAVMMTLCNLVAGATLVLPIEFTPATALHALSARGVTHTLLVPAMIRWLLLQPDLDAHPVTTLRALVYGAAPMPSALLAQVMTRFPCDLLQGYGLTETAGVLTVLRPADHHVASRRLSAGQPLSCCEVRVVRADGEIAPVGEPGEVEARGTNLLQGYHGLAADTSMHEGWFCTGDVGYLDPDGYLFLVDRKKDMILVGGENVYPSEVEAVIAEVPGVAEVAVIGVPHEVFGESVHAVVVAPDAGDDLRRLVIRACRAGLARYKCPTSVEVVAALPRNAAGKVLKAELRRPFWEGRERNI